MGTRSAAIAVFLFLSSLAHADEKAAAAPFSQLESVTAFDQLLASLTEMRAMILGDAANEREASEGMRFPLRALAMAQDVSRDGYPLAPHFARMDTRRRKVGGDNPNAEYDSVAWDGRSDYKITGNIGSVDNLYMIGTYGFETSEALIVEVDPLDVRYWNFAIENPWHESVDYLQRKTARTHDDVTVDPDGKVRFLIAHARTDHPNYLETAGHSRGFMTFRWLGEHGTKAPLPMLTKLPLAQAIAQARKLGGR